MNKITLFSISAVFVVMAATAAAVQNDAENPRSLQAAVEEFNKKAAGDSVGKTQPPLTEEEVIAAIRGWIPERTPRATDEVLKEYQNIAETHELPKGAELRFTTRWTGYNGFRFRVWWVDLNIETGERTGYGFRIRDHKISSQRMSPAELAEQERRNEFFFEHMSEDEAPN